MQSELELFTGASNAPFSLNEFLINLLLGAALAIVVRWHFLRYGSTLSNRDELAGVLPFILLTTILIITVVKSSLALSLGLVGALSIVRFRTPIKEPEELAYLFLAIAIGLGLGANQVVPTLVAGAFILLAMTLIKQFNRSASAKNLYLSVGLGSVDAAATPIDDLNAVISQHVRSCDLRRFDDRSQSLEATYLLDVDSTQDLSRLSAALKGAFPEITITFLDQNGMPGI